MAHLKDCSLHHKSFPTFKLLLAKTLPLNVCLAVLRLIASDASTEAVFSEFALIGRSAASIFGAPIVIAEIVEEVT